MNIDKPMPWKACVLFAGGLMAVGLHAENGSAAWLRYAPVAAPVPLPAAIASFGGSGLIANARNEMVRGVRGMTGHTLRSVAVMPNEAAILIGRLTELPPQLHLSAELAPDGYWLTTAAMNGIPYTVVTGATDRGVLYGAFAMLRKIGTGEAVARLDEKQSPAAAVRWVNQWDNLDGSIERGYGGRSIFWDNLHARADLTRVSEYGRLLASLGINACAINNVNANPRLLASEFVPEVAQIAAAFRPWGVQVAVAVDFGSPKTIGGLDTFDPLEPRVAAWWKAKADELYAAVPDLAGVVLKADSEGRVGPSTYGRTHADAANVVARGLQPHGGLLLYRGFVYDHHADWRDPKADRARAAYDNFQPLDGKFDANVIVQIKHGPIDFQVREPVSPLFGSLEKTSRAIELQITQEYFGQARHTVFLAPMWKEALDFDLHAADGSHSGATPVKAMLRGFVGVANVGLDDNWLGNHLSQANLYGFGRLAWNPDLTAEEIVKEWTKLTFGSDTQVVGTVSAIQLSSWRTYENYTGPLGLQTLTDIVGNHYGVSVEASERNGWGQWHNADEQGVGMERTMSKGTGYTGQYRAPVAKMYESLASCPDDLLLFLHHVPYSYKLHSGKTVIQSLYDSHYEGAETVARYLGEWRGLKGRIDDQRYEAVLAQLQYQSGAAVVWRDAVANWFHRASGIPDGQGRVGNHPGRFEAEAMQLEGYRVVDVTPWEAASGGKAIACAAASCTAAQRFEGEAGWYKLTVQYFDQVNGVSRFRLRVGTQVVDEWSAADRLPTRKLDGTSSTRRVVNGIALRPGDEIRIEGAPDGDETAALDYLEIIRDRN